MDIFSNHLVSFNAAIWARARRFNPRTVKLRIHLQLIAKTKCERDKLDEIIEINEAAVRKISAEIEEIQKGE